MKILILYILGLIISFCLIIIGIQKSKESSNDNSKIKTKNNSHFIYILGLILFSLFTFLLFTTLFFLRNPRRNNIIPIIEFQPVDAA